MGRRKGQVPGNAVPEKTRPATTPEARENQMISLAIDLAEKQLREGTASSQVISHYLKLGSSTERLNRQMLELQKKLVEEKTKTLQSQQRTEELYANAIEAMARYSGNADEEVYEDGDGYG